MPLHLTAVRERDPFRQSIRPFALPLIWQSLNGDTCSVEQVEQKSYIYAMTYEHDDAPADEQ